MKQKARKRVFVDVGRISAFSITLLLLLLPNAYAVPQSAPPQWCEQRTFFGVGQGEYKQICEEMATDDALAHLYNNDSCTLIHFVEPICQYIVKIEMDGTQEIIGWLSINPAIAISICCY